MPIKLPVFSKRFQRQMVSVTPAFDLEMVHIAEIRLEKMVAEQIVSSSLAGTLRQILQEHYCHPSVIGLSSYSQQVTVLNNRLWKQLFPTFKTLPEIFYIEQEKIVSQLLKSDLSNPKSLAWSVMFDPALREKILNNLDGVRGCWEWSKLVQQCHAHPEKIFQQHSREKCGTIFFWGIDRSKRRVPLILWTNTSKQEMLRGIDDYGQVWEIPYTPQAIIKGLHENTLLPSNFTCFLVLSFARGLVCVGGYFQSDYLPTIQQGVAAALQNISGYDKMAYLVAQVPTNWYLDSMLSCMTRLEGGLLIPAGPIEIIASGGLTNDDLEKMLALTIREAHLADMYDTTTDAVPIELRQPGWKKQLASDCFQLLEGKIVAK